MQEAAIDLSHEPKPTTRSPRPLDVIVIGAGQAGLSVGHYLAKRGLAFVILDANDRIGDCWRRRWDSLKLFTPARFDSLDGLPFPLPPDAFPTREQMADYLETYARHFELPVLNGVRVERVFERGGRYVVRSGGREWSAEQVVVAMASYQEPRTPEFARLLRPELRQLHSREYRNPAQLQDGPVLVVGAGNSGAEIGLELARTGRKVWLSGRSTGQVPFRIASFWGKWLLGPLLLRFLFHRVLTIRTFMGRKARAQSARGGVPLIRTRLADLVRAGVQRCGRVVGVASGLPALEDGRALDVANVIWCSGFHHGLSWIDLPIFDESQEPRHEAGVVPSAPGLYFVGLHFLYSMSSTMIHGVGRDAARIAAHVARRARVSVVFPRA